MNAISRVIGEKKQWKEYKERKKRLPANYRAAVDALERHIFYVGPETGAATTNALEDLIDLFEQSAATNTPIRDIVGEHPADFAEEFVNNYTEDTWRERQVRKVNQALESAIRM